MLKRLRIKFILVIMGIVTLLFAGIFGTVMHLTKQNLERESIRMMRTLTFRPPDDGPMHRPDNQPNSKPDNKPDNKPDGRRGSQPESIPEDVLFGQRGGIRLPYFTVEIAKDGTLTQTGGEAFGLTGADDLTEIVQTAEAGAEQSGVVPGYDLRFMKSESRGEKTIVFADISSEKAMLRGLMRNCILIGGIAYAVLFVISLLLAKWVTKPVERAWNEQKQFVADASHELKTPLTVIMTNAEMLADKSYTETDKEQFTDNILSTSKRMRGLVESLLELARLDSGRAQQTFADVDLSRLINDSILPFEPLFYENGTELDTDVEAGITVTGDKERLRQVVTILLDNALKYCDAAGKVTVRLKRQSAGCLLTVSNPGASLSKDECRNIFQRFYRVDPSRNDGKSYGLGLSIAESIVNEHGGRIWAESENGCNTFSVTL